jgi:ABC-type branched-subunit amino acid transport system substrate-binding protein
MAPPPGELEIMENLPPAEEQPVKVALLLPLSGRLAGLGKAMSDAAQMAVFDLAESRFQLMPIDDRGTSDGAAAAARQAIAGGAQLILGPLLAGSVSAVAPLATEAGIPVIAFSNDRKVAGPGVYIIGFTPDTEVQRVISFAAQSGLTRFAVVAPDNPYGLAVVAAMRGAVDQYEAKLARVQLYDSDTKDFAPVVRKLLGLPDPAAPGAPAAASAPPSGPPAGVPPFSSAVVVAPPAGGESSSPPVLAPPRSFDALLLAEGGAQLRSLATSLSSMGVRSPAVQLLGTGKWDEPDIGNEAALYGAWFAAPSSVNREDFDITYRRTFGQSPPRLATLAYDATALAAVLARGPQTDPFNRSMLTDPNGFYGRDGLFRLGADGVAERRLAILRVDHNGVTVIDEPVPSFAAGS